MTQTKTIVRIPTDLTVTDTLLTNIKAQVGEDIVTEAYSAKIDTRKHMQARIQSMRDAFIYYVKAHPTDKISEERITAFANEAYSRVQLTENQPLHSYKTQLKGFTEQLTNAIQQYWDMTPKAAIEHLNKAEQYLIASNPREAVATLTKITEDRFHLAVDMPAAAFHPETLIELETIKKTPDYRIPDWFQKLGDLERLYLHSLPITEASSVTDIKSDLLKLRDSIRSNDPKQIAPHHKAFIAAIKTKPYDGAYDKALTNLDEFIRNQVNNDAFVPHCVALKNRPIWFFYLEPYEQDLLLYTIANAENPANIWLPSRLRTIPGLANHLMHHSFWLDESGNVLNKMAAKERASHPSSRDVKNHPVWISNIHVLRNLAAIAKGHLNTLIQTLISPLNYGGDFLPDSFLDATLTKAVEQPQVIQTNHPLNAAQTVQSFGNLVSLELVKQHDPSNITNLLAIAEALIKTNEEAHIALKKAIAAFNYASSESDTVGAYHARQLVLATLEQTIAVHSAIHSFGACVSGKDRKAIELMHSDAYWVYYQLYGEWPKYAEEDNTKRQNFIDIFVKIYISGHQRYLSAQNATGAYGIKTPRKYLPRVIIDALVALRINLNEEDELADLNELREIIEKAVSPTPSSTEHLVTAATLSSEQKETFLAALNHIVFDSAYLWNGATAENIEYKIKPTLLNNAYTSDQKICYIFDTVKNIVPNTSRAPITTALYDAIKMVKHAIATATPNSSAIDDAIASIKAIHPYKDSVFSPVQKTAFLNDLQRIVKDSDYLWGSKPATGIVTIKETLANDKLSPEHKIHLIITTAHDRLKSTSIGERLPITTSVYTAIMAVHNAVITDPKMSIAVDKAIAQFKILNAYENQTKLISPKNRDDLIKKLKVITGSDAFWSTNNNLGFSSVMPSVPVGIDKMKVVLMRVPPKDPALLDATCVSVLANIFRIANSQLNKPPSLIFPRSDTTTNFYTALNNLASSPKITQGAVDKLLASLDALEVKIKEYREKNSTIQMIEAKAACP